MYYYFSTYFRSTLNVPQRASMYNKRWEQNRSAESKSLLRRILRPSHTQLGAHDT